MFLKDNVRIQEHGMFTSAIKKQTPVCCSILLNPYVIFQTWNHGGKKRKAILLLALYC